ncbi:uncharacterized protein LOC105695693 [Orussus abietinus]|uniref:uncharacterized protein LOC105695693 n=1 Tax=Orussus abietinus TaxID=222816 RepID=UPI000626D03F|nr:uncharacterized protein LOC105695693 [Orussus abietinus]
MARGDAAWTLAILVLAALATRGSSLRCWQCSSDMNSVCGDPMNNTEHHSLFHTRDCETTFAQHPYPYEKAVCRKIVQRVHGERVIVRACAIPNPDERDIVDGPCTPVVSASYITIESCHICRTDLCNSATSLSGLSAKGLLGFAAIGLILASAATTTR